MPLDEKCVQGQKLCRDFVLEDSFLITNVGEFKLPACCLPYVLDYGAVLPSAAQPFALLISSYNGTMKLSIAQRDHDLTVVSDLARSLDALGVHTETRSYPFAVTKYDGKRCG
ncbi:hypothetical protein RWV98_16545 [Agathobaculum sp. NTUH-O15-33]|uniref:hypothetical protein n=1 Tax=Agathobaculum sp. NTUH-O15-33 TaxID=3079302 RepID=UPI00295886C6|nr:hypothetical protein [Agathobaculum sp. NTUH-O15-33]WNX84163.1 hypothetical protein RWV98_16545 [Agathobaculum sp. NTUH-O15-33]